MKAMYSVTQVAYIIKVHPLTVRRYIREKKLAAVKMGGCVRIREDHLEAFQRVYESQGKHSISLSKQPIVFNELDPLWQLEGVGMSVNVKNASHPYGTKR